MMTETDDFYLVNLDTIRYVRGNDKSRHDVIEVHFTNGDVEFFSGDVGQQLARRLTYMCIMESQNPNWFATEPTTTTQPEAVAAPTEPLEYDPAEDIPF